MAEAAAVLDPKDAEPDAAEETSGTPAPDAGPSSAPAGGGSVLLGKRFQILYNEPIPELNSPSAKAYRVIDQRDPAWSLFALICTPGLPPRMNAMSTLKGDTLKGILPLAAWGVIDFPPLGQKVTAVVFQTPLGGRLTETNDTIEGQVSEYDLSRKIVEPLSAALQELATGGLRHRAIRPNNLFFMDEKREHLVLGDCVTSPPGFDQPSLFEPIERSMADPAGRGHGETNDDLYALGVTLACIIIGRNPAAHLNEEEILKSKIEKGTYATLCSEERIPLQLIEPLRGMMSDDPSERWGLEELEYWLNGQKRSPIQKKPAILAREPFTFLDSEHNTPRTLAHAFSKNVAEACEALLSGKVELWVRSITGAAHAADDLVDLVSAVAPGKNAPPPDKEMLVAKACIVMDPLGPIRFKGLSALPQGFGAAVAAELLRKGNMQVPTEILISDLPDMWFRKQPDYDPETSTLQKTFGELRGLVKIGDPGYGPERVLYELNPSLPCQSSILINDYVVNIQDLLPTLDNIANRSDPSTKPMDRHIAAFIATRFTMDMTPHLKALADPDPETSLIGMLSLLALLQWKLKPSPLYGLSSWVGGLLGPAINTYHSRTTRRQIEQDIPKLVRRGSLPELFDLIDNAERRKRDEAGFAEFQARFATMDMEIDKLEGRSKSGQDNMKETGEKTAATISVIIAMILGTVLFLMEIW